VSQGNKYDTIVMKNTIEMIAKDIASLDEYIVALYKTLKLNGICVLVARLRPTLPLPAAMLSAWAAHVPDEQKFKVVRKRIHAHLYTGGGRRRRLGL
jgi:hypothetical protein